MSKSIKISPKYGVNPCIPVCAFCGQEKNEVALLGKLKGDIEAPMSAVLDYNPCDDCQANWAKGVAILRVTDQASETGAIPLTEHNGVKLYPTAQYVVMTAEAVKRLFDMDAEIGKPIMMDTRAFDELMEMAEKDNTLPNE